MYVGRIILTCATLTLVRTCINGESYQNILAYQSQRILANFMQIVGLRNTCTRCTCHVYVTYLCAAYMYDAMPLRSYFDSTAFNSYVWRIYCASWRKHCVQISCTHCTVVILSLVQQVFCLDICNLRLLIKALRAPSSRNF